jgi:curved DNA-binding protein
MDVMQADPYELLGVAPDATGAEITAAYRALARRLHPDVNDDPDAAEHFKVLTGAYNTLSDPDARARHDRDEAARTSASADPFATWSATGPDLGWFGDVFTQRPPLVAGEVAVDLESAHTGGSVDLQLPSGASATVRLPAGVAHGQVVRAVVDGIEVHLKVLVAEHPRFTRHGDDLDVVVRVPFDTLVLGGTVEVPTLDGAVTIKVASGTPPGTRLRVAGAGTGPTNRRGDLYARVELALTGGPAERAAAEHLRGGR